MNAQRFIQLEREHRFRGYPDRPAAGDQIGPHAGSGAGARANGGAFPMTGDRADDRSDQRAPAHELARPLVLPQTLPAVRFDVGGVQLVQLAIHRNRLQIQDQIRFSREPPAFRSRAYNNLRVRSARNHDVAGRIADVSGNLGGEGLALHRLFGIDGLIGTHGVKLMSPR